MTAPSKAPLYGLWCGLCRYTLCSSAALLSILLAPVVSAQDDEGSNGGANEEFTVSGFAEVGAEYNSNISVSELETAAGESDTALMLDLGLDFSWNPAERLTAEGGYSFSKRNYRDVGAFDLDMHLLYGDLSYEFDQLTVGSSYYHADADLGSESFLQLGQFSVYAGKLFAQQWYLRGALNFTDKDFDQFSDRNADNDGLSLDAFWFLNEGRTTLMLGYAYEDETTRSDPFTYTADSLRARLTHRISVLEKDARLQLGVRMQNRDYSYITPSIDETRYDKQRVADARLEVSLNEYLELIGRLEFGDFTSNLDTADYNDNRASISIRASF